jgi:hypothetical protein
MCQKHHKTPLLQRDKIRLAYGDVGENGLLHDFHHADGRVAVPSGLSRVTWICFHACHVSTLNALSKLS